MSQRTGTELGGKAVAYYSINGGDKRAFRVRLHNHDSLLRLPVVQRQLERVPLQRGGMQQCEHVVGFAGTAYDAADVTAGIRDAKDAPHFTHDTHNKQREARDAVVWRVQLPKNSHHNEKWVVDSERGNTHTRTQGRVGALSGHTCSAYDSTDTIWRNVSGTTTGKGTPRAWERHVVTPAACTMP